MATFPLAHREGDGWLGGICYRLGWDDTCFSNLPPLSCYLPPEALPHQQVGYGATAGRLFLSRRQSFRGGIPDWNVRPSLS
jgi:hypothetical protein